MSRQMAQTNGVKYSIQLKIGVILILGITLIFSVFAVVQYRVWKTEKIAFLNELANNATERLMTSLALPLWDLYREPIEEIVLSEMKEKHIYAIILDAKDATLGRIGKMRDATTWEAIDLEGEIAEAFLEVKKDITKDNVSLGTISLYVTSQFIIAELHQEVRTLIVVALVLDMALFLILVLSLQWMLVRPIRHMGIIADTISQGDFRQNIHIRQNDEIGKLAGAFQLMNDKILEVLQEIKRLIQAIQAGQLDVRGTTESFTGQWRELVEGIHGMTQAIVDPFTVIAATIESLSAGDLTHQVTQEYQGDFHKMTGALNTMIQTLGAVVVNIERTSNHVAASSQELRMNAENVSQGVSQQASATEEVSSAMEEMTATIHQNMENAQAAEKMAAAAAEDAKKGGSAVTQTIEAMKTIAERISIIQEIAMQTKVLSLNASIEASKAQDFGKGFSVVAAEVRELARRTNEAAEEIGRLVRSCEIVSEEAGAILQRLVPNSGKTAELVQKISVASSEQYSGAEQINQAMQQLDSVIQQNSATAEEMAASADVLATQAKQLQDTIAFFTIPDEEQTPLKMDSPMLKSIQNLLITLDESQLTQLVNTVNTLKQTGQLTRNPDRHHQLQPPPIDTSVSSEEPKAIKQMFPLSSQDKIDTDFERF